MSIDNSVLYEVMKSQYDSLVNDYKEICNHPEIYRHQWHCQEILNFGNKCGILQETYEEIIDNLFYDGIYSDLVVPEDYNPSLDDYEYGFGVLMDSFYQLRESFKQKAIEAM